MDDRMTHRQNLSMLFVGVLSPAIRLLPRYASRRVALTASRTCADTIIYWYMKSLSPIGRRERN